MKRSWVGACLDILTMREANVASGIRDNIRSVTKSER